MKKFIETALVVLLFVLATHIADAESAFELDFIINQEINMVGNLEDRILGIEPLIVKNNSDLYDIKITEISAEAVNGWEIVDKDIDFNSIPANNKKISLSTLDGYDLKEKFDADIYIASKSNKEVELSGKICKTYPSKEKTEIAKIVVEIMPVLDSETVLYEDGTFIINELTYKRAENQRKHGAILNTYPSLGKENDYVMQDSKTVLWGEDASNIKHVEIGSYIKPISTAYWFFNCYNLETFDSVNLDMSDCNSTYMMFYCAGKNVTTAFKLTGIDEWDVSNVTNFAGMFNQAGYGATEWDVGDLGKWQTKSAENISNMFYRAGFYSNKWDIGDIGSWDVSKVKYFISTFDAAGNYASTWHVGDLSSWKMDSAIDVSNMFAGAGYYAESWNIGDLSNWNISNVTNIEGMFKNAGRIAKEINLGSFDWDLSNLNKTKEIFYNFGYNSERVTIGTITISNNNNLSNAFRSSKNMIATIKVKDYVNNNSRVLQTTATGENGNIQLVPLSDEGIRWCNEIIGLYGQNGTMTRGNIWI